MTYNLADMLTYARPHGSRQERLFIAKYIKPLGARRDGYGNLILRIGEPRVLWSAHTDTVHIKGKRQQVDISKDGRIASTKENNGALGGDDTAGVYILCKLASAGVPGLYIWHRDEEAGANGSEWIAKNTPELLDGIDYAIAFDRYGYDSIVTHQTFRTASDTFADALAAALPSLSMAADPTGIFTDTLSYAKLIPECTNISVGYECAHTHRESQDLQFPDAIIRAFANVDFDTIPVTRDPSVTEYDSWGDEGDISDWSDLLEAIASDVVQAADLLWERGVRAEDLEVTV